MSSNKRYVRIAAMSPIRGLQNISRWISIPCAGMQDPKEYQDKLYYMYRNKHPNAREANFSLMLLVDDPNYRPASGRTPEQIKVYAHEYYPPGHIFLTRLQHNRYVVGKVYELVTPNTKKKYKATIKGGATVTVEASTPEEADTLLRRKSLAPTDIRLVEEAIQQPLIQ